MVRRAAFRLQVSWMRCVGNLLSASTLPTLVVWGESDRIVDPDYGRAYADAIPTATFQLLEATGHLPQVETPERPASVIWEFADRGISNSEP